MSLDLSVPTSHPRPVPDAFWERRCLAMLVASSASTAPVPSEASTLARTSCHQVLFETLRLAPARRMARHPSGHDLSVASTFWISAAQPAAAGEAMLVPLMVSPTVVTEVPLAAISGSTRSPCVLDGFRKTESPDIADAVSSW